jgi:predicted enzyme related to lactoylglutathione lyase
MDAVITWHELITSDVEAAARFYTELLGLELETADMGDFQYPMLRKNGRTHAGFVAQEQAGTPAHWYPYVAVENVDRATDAAKAAGAQLYHGPADVSERLRFAALGDPQGASFGVMRWAEEPPTGVFAWDELHATDPDAAASFYGGLFGWTTAPFVEEYRLFNLGETGVGGLMQERGGSSVGNWLAYFAVEDTDAAATKAMELGAGVILPPESMEQVGRYAVLTDSTGAAFGLHQPLAESQVSPE